MDLGSCVDEALIFPNKQAVKENMKGNKEGLKQDKEQRGK